MSKASKICNIGQNFPCYLVTTALCQKGKQGDKQKDRLAGHSSLPKPVGSVPEVIKSPFHTEGETDKRGRRKGTGQSILRKHRSQEASSMKKEGQKKRERKRGFSQRSQENDRQNHSEQCWVFVHSAAVQSLTITAVNSGD